jgi:hypothetical protein
MGKQTWGTFSVKDHCQPNAFVAEVMLYDRLVIPVPPRNDEQEIKRWHDNGWDPERLEKLLNILGDRAYTLEWDEHKRQLWKTRYDAGTDVAQQTGDWAFAATRTELTQNLPRNVTGIQAISNYSSVQELEEDLGLKAASPEQLPIYGGAAIAVLGHQFLVPNDPKISYEDLLKQAVELSSERAYQRKRASFWRWQREFLDSKGITDLSAITEAVKEMHELLEEEKTLLLNKKILTGTQYAFLVGSVTLGLFGGPLTAVAVGGAFVSISQFISEKIFDKSQNDFDKPVALLRDIRKHFGWK